MVFGYDVGGDVEIELVTDQSKAQAARLAFAADDTTDTREFGGEELIVVNKGIITIEKVPFSAFLRGEFL